MSEQTQETAVSPIPFSSWHHNIVYPLLIASMTTLIVSAITATLHSANTTLPWGGLNILAFLATLEGVYSSRWLNNLDQLMVSHMLYRLAELTVIALIVRLYAWFALGSSLPTLFAVQQYLRHPLDFFSDPFFIISLTLVALAWQRGIAFGNLFQELAISRAEEAYFHSGSKQDRWHNDAPIHTERSKLVASFFRQWAVGGVVLVVCVGLSTFALDEASGINLLALARRSLQPHLLLALLLYLLIGFWLLAQARLAWLNGRWLFEGIVPTPDLMQHWSRSSFWLLLLIALAAAFIPIGSTFPASRLLTTLLAGILYIVNFLFYVVALLFLNLLGLLLPNMESSAATAAPPPPPPAELLPPAAAASSGELLAMVVSSLFWTAVLAGTIAAILFVIHDRGKLLNWQLGQRIWFLLLSWLREKFGAFWRQMDSLQFKWPTGWEMKRKQGEEIEKNGRFPRFFRLSSMPPREQIRYFYLTTLKRAGQRGVARSAHQTPSEYAAQLKDNWPDGNDDIDQLTNVFLHAQYNPAPIPSDALPMHKAAWQRLKRLLRGQTTRSKP